MLSMTVFMSMVRLWFCYTISNQLSIVSINIWAMFKVSELMPITSDAVPLVSPTFSRQNQKWNYFSLSLKESELSDTFCNKDWIWRDT